MTTPEGFDRFLTAWFEAEAPRRAPEQLADTVILRVAETRRRPSWLIPERWFSVQAITRLTVVPPAARAVLVILVLLIALIVAAVMVGSRPRVPPPFGVAKPGLIAFDLNGAIFVSNLDGTGRRLVSDPGPASDPQWSRDGTRLAYWSGSAAGPVALHVVNADGTGRHVVASGLDPSVLNWPFVWAPDGRDLAYATQMGTIDLDVVSVDGGSPLTVYKEAPLGAQPAWSPDSRSIAFLGGSTWDEWGVWVVAADGTGGARRVSKVAGSLGSFNDVQWSPDGRHLAFRAGEAIGDYRIYVIDADGKGEHRLTDSSNNEMFPAWSPTGSRLVFGREVGPGDGTTGPIFQLVIAAADGTNLVRLDHPPAAAGSWGWWPDETRIIAGTASGFLRIDVANAAPPVPIPVDRSTGAVDEQRLAP